MDQVSGISEIKSTRVYLWCIEVKSRLDGIRCCCWLMERLEVHDIAVEAVVEGFEGWVGVHDARVVFGRSHEVVDEAGRYSLFAVWFADIQADEVWEVCRFGVCDVTVFVVGVCDEYRTMTCIGVGW